MPISESKNCKLSLSGKPTEHFESKTTGTVTVNVYPHGWANVNGTKYYFRLGYKETGWVRMRTLVIGTILIKTAIW